MFFKTSKRPHNRIETLIGAATVINGDIEFSGGLRIDGAVHGSISEVSATPGILVVSEHGRIDGAVHGSISEVSATPGILVVSEHGRIDGPINVSHATINGVVNGPVNATEYVELQAKARVTGDVRYKTLEMFVGAIVDGKLVHVGDSAASLGADD